MMRRATLTSLRLAACQLATPAANAELSTALRSISVPVARGLLESSVPTTPAAPARGFAAHGLDQKDNRDAEKQPGSAGFATAAEAPPAVEFHAGMKKKAVVKEYAKDLRYSVEYAESVRPYHKPPTNLTEKAAYNAIQAARTVFDKVTGYDHAVPQTEQQWVNRVVFLETVAGVPGMVGGMLRHLRSLRLMRHDQGWIHMLLEEAENERMHLLTFMEIKNPGIWFRAAVLLSQGIYFNIFFISYLLSPKFCHAIVGYLEEEAVKTYTHMLEDIDAGRLWKNTPAPKTGIDYWKLAPDATMRDLVLAVRADEACHSHVNHTLSTIKASDPNPFDVDPSLEHASPSKKN